jgi:hypothetical protein
MLSKVGEARAELQLVSRQGITQKRLAYTMWKNIEKNTILYGAELFVHSFFHRY